MTLSRSARFAIAMPLFIVALPGLCLWGLGTVLTLAGRSLWMFCHRLCRDENCVCEECLDFDPEFVSAHRAAAAEPPAAA